MSIIPDLWRLMRPRQWVKSGFVLVGVLFAHAWHDAQMLRSALIAAAAFSLVASGVYIINDLADRDHDASHPRKQHRPIAAGRLPLSVAYIFLSLLLVAGFVLGYLASIKVASILLAYLVINLAYSLGLKNVVILDVFIIAAGFMLRLLAGTLGIGIAPSQWLLLCGLMLSLFLGFAKRRAELYALSTDGVGGRRVLQNYQPVLLDKLIVVTAGCAVLSYSLYTTSDKTVQTHHTEGLIYTVPFVMYGIFRYIYLLHNQTAGTDPAQEVFRDLHILISIAGWIALTVWLIA